MNKIYFILILVSTFQLNAQIERHQINGKIHSNSLAIENAHVVNKTSNKGTATNSFGIFQISVKENDTLFFSSIQHKNKTVIINKNHLKNNFIRIELLQKTNELKEVVIIRPKNIAVGLGLPNAGKEPLKPIERKLNYIKKGGNINKLYAWISGEKKRLKTLQKHMDEDKVLANNIIEVQKIRNHFKEDFFVHTLKISKENIDGFLHFCLPKGTVFLFEKQRYLEVVDIFIQNKEEYLKQITSLKYEPHY